MATVSSLKTWRRSAKNSKSTNKSRRDGVRAAYNNGFKLDGYYTKIKNKIDECTSELSNGIKGMGTTLSSKCSAITSGRESQILSDQYQFSTALSYLVREINRCQNNMDYYDGKIADYERQIKEQGGVILPWE